MEFSQNDKDHFADMWAQTVYIEGIMLDIILPIRAILRSVVIKNVQSLTKTELLRNDALSETNIGEELMIENSIHVTLPKNFLNGYPQSYVNSIDVILDPWNLQKNTFVENRIVIIKTLNEIPLSNEQRKTMIRDESGKNCDIFCQCGKKTDRNCSYCENKHKKNCAICIKNKMKIDDKDLYRQVCSFEDISIVDVCLKYIRLQPLQTFSKLQNQNLKQCKLFKQRVPSHIC